MSRTEAHLPLWVVAMREGRVEHDHSKGECKIAPIHDDGVVLKHHRHCKKIVSVKWITCDHAKKIKVFRTVHERLTGQVTVEYNVACDFDNFKTYFGVPRTTHELYEVERDEDIACSCDEMPRAGDFTCWVEVPSHEVARHFPSRGGYSCGCCSPIDREPTHNEVRMNLANAAAAWNSLTPEEREDFDWDGIV